MTYYLKSYELILNYWQDGYVTTFMLKDTRNWHLYQKEIGQGRITFVISPVDGGRSTPGPAVLI